MNVSNKTVNRTCFKQEHEIGQDKLVATRQGKKLSNIQLTTFYSAVFLATSQFKSSEFFLSGLFMKQLLMIGQCMSSNNFEFRVNRIPYQRVNWNSILYFVYVHTYTGSGIYFQKFVKTIH
jgi:hypothetical protein